MVIPSASTNPARPGLTSELLGLPSFFIAKIFSQTPPSPLGVFQFALLFALKRLLIHWLIDWFTAGLINNQWIYFRTTILDSVARANFSPYKQGQRPPLRLVHTYDANISISTRERLVLASSRHTRASSCAYACVVRVNQPLPSGQKQIWVKANINI